MTRIHIRNGMRILVLMCFVGLVVIVTACQILPGSRATPTVRVLADTFFSGKAFIDANNNQEIDDQDMPLAGAQFTLAGFGAKTDASGHATVVIPGGWGQAVTAHMAPPEGSGYSLIGPSEVVLQNGGRTSAEFLFAAPPMAAASEAPETVTASVEQPTTTPTSGATPLPSQTPLGASSPGGTPRPGQLSVNVTYCTNGGVPLTMDIYQPRVLDDPSPVIVYVHGGGWSSGDKSDGIGTIFFNEFQRRGYLVASVNYRLAPRFKFPAMIEDVKCAIRFLRAHADTYHLDPERIGVVGGSAGGHLVALLGTANESAGWDTGEYLDQSSRVQAVVDMFGPADLTLLVEEGNRGMGERVFGLTQADDERLRTFSPVAYVTPDDAPFLILHGDKDELVPLEQSEVLLQTLQEMGVPAELVVVKNAGHSFRPVDGDPIPNLLQLTQMVAEFFETYLR